MAPTATFASRKKEHAKPGPVIPANWQERFLAYYKANGTMYRAAEAASVSMDTVRRYRDSDPDFAAKLAEATEYAADVVEEAMVNSAKETGNPAGFIVRLKAMRPAQYIEKNVSISLGLTAEVQGHDVIPALRAMLESASPAAKLMLTANTDETRETGRGATARLHDGSSATAPAGDTAPTGGTTAETPDA